MSNTIESINLHYLGGGSDKVYNAEIVANVDGTYSVPFEYGRRGSTMNTGEKVSGASLARARAAFSKIVSEKTGKGYKVVDSYSDPIAAQIAPTTSAKPKVWKMPEFSGFRPQLLTVADETDVAECLTDDDWAMQGKYDGERHSVIITSTAFDTQPSRVIGSNKLGRAIIIPSELEADTAKLPPDTIIDGEFVGGVLMAFDILRYDGNDLSGRGYLERYRYLEQVCSTCGLQNIRCVEIALGSEKKKSLFEQIKSSNGEGVVFKLTGAYFREGKTLDQLKFKFVESASVIVTAKNDKRSVAIAVLDQSGRFLPVGNVTIPVNATIPKIGSIVEVQYLYYYGEGGSLAQPVYLGVRSDVLEGECAVSQLKLKPELNQAAA